MPRVRLFNSIFHLWKFNAKLIEFIKNNPFSFFHKFEQHCVEWSFTFFYYAEMRGKLWPKAPAKEGALDQKSKNFQVYFIHIIFFKQPSKKIDNRAEELYCNATIYIFFLIIYCPKKMETDKWLKGLYLVRILKKRYLKNGFIDRSEIFTQFFWIYFPVINPRVYFSDFFFSLYR